MEGMKPLSSPGLTEITDCFKKEDDKKEGNAEVRKRALEHGSDSLFRALTARINYIAQDRADLVFASNCVSHFMSETHTSSLAGTEEDWKVSDRSSQNPSDVQVG